MVLNIRTVQLNDSLIFILLTNGYCYTCSLIPPCRSALIPDLLLKFIYKWTKEMVICFTAYTMLGHDPAA